MKEVNKFFAVRTTRVNDEDKFIITTGTVMACKKVFDTQKEAEEYIKEHLSEETTELIASLIAGMFNYLNTEKK